ncbi:sigma-54-dependent transcriptional regulator [Candidatus Paracaedibacter symbiosus]|uniref:sigma-54-dependent transcriptional regulator n=1 Tax=Candidatus Paracaedibacter symbiosus TaxID=244582 RepID=UPI00068BD6B1|nr:sigma-54 dependent transcriptional regulator [Candidatus Paracaedibacter symbiosus]
MKVMIIGEFAGQIGVAAKMAMARGAKVSHVETIDQGLKSLRSGQGADVLFVDVNLDIKQLNSTLTQERFVVPIVACGINTEPAVAAQAIRSGAKEYMPFPPDADLIAAILETISKPQDSFICCDPAMQRMVILADRIAPSEANILITGESGTGKEVMAKYIHLKSQRANKPFVSVNCAAIPENLLESELFGHEKGAFTGAVARRIGKFEEANNGTLLLDEISEMHPRLQAKLLRAIQEKVIDRVGGSKPVSVNIRIIATSNRDLVQSCKTGDFREDLYYRLNVVNLHLPTLRERPKDIEALATHFVKKFSELNHLGVMTLSPAAVSALVKHSWSGNVRELQNTIHRAVLLAGSVIIEVEDLFDPSTMATKNVNVTSTLDRQLLIGTTLATMEKELILGTLDHCSGNKTHAANILGISIRTLRNKLHEYELHKSSMGEEVKYAM